MKDSHTRLRDWEAEFDELWNREFPQYKTLNGDFKQFIRSTLSTELESIRREIEAMKKCVFESDGEKHCCYNGCEGTVENCRKCRRDICDNEKCPNGKSDNNYCKFYNEAIDEVLKLLSNRIQK